ncbi:MAG: phage head closure protein [Candidatus Neomarinimicrobiota bacterium]
MARCQIIGPKHKKICAGDLRQRIEIQTRSITSPADCINFDELFTTVETVFASIETVNGQTVFDSTNTEVIVTHKIYIRFLSTVTAETWLQFNNEKYDILKVENIDNRNEYLILRCNKRGINTKDVNFA